MKFPWRYILVSALVGLCLGGAAGLYCSPHVENHWTKKSGEIFLQHLDNEIHLNASQHSQISTLIAVNHGKVIAYQDQIRNDVRAQIRALLMPEQQGRFEAMVARHDAKRKKHETE